MFDYLGLDSDALHQDSQHYQFGNAREDKSNWSEKQAKELFNALGHHKTHNIIVAKVLFKDIPNSSLLQIVNQEVCKPNKQTGE